MKFIIIIAATMIAATFGAAIDANASKTKSHVLKSMALQIRDNILRK